jgi:hypothetical protein
MLPSNFMSVEYSTYLRIALPSQIVRRAATRLYSAMAESDPG